MRRILMMACLVMYFTAGAQNNQWIINTSSLGVSFQTPTTPTVYTSDSIHDNPEFETVPGFMYYNCSIDSSISLQVHILDNAVLDFSDEIVDSVFIANDGDTLRTIAAMMTAFVPCNITELVTVSAPVNGMEVGLQTTYDPEKTEYIFSRYFVRNNRFFSFTITGGANDLIKMMAYKEDFYNSIAFNY
jgi:hypothetical protein